jgi:putative peptidoglycan lipid II flippase
MSLNRHISIVGFHTALGRFLGYLRDSLVVAALGATAIADALFIATKIASLFRRLFTEGAFNASFIPIFGSLKEKKGDKKAVYFAEQAIMWMIVIIGIITLYVLSFTESFVGLIAAGFKDDPEKFQWTVEFTRIVFPFILLICITAVVGAVLNAVHNFVQTAASQTVGNLSIILLFLAFQDIAETKAHAAAWAILISAAIQLVWLYVVAVRLGIVILPTLPRLTSPLREFMKRLLPGIFGTGMVQINVLINIYFGSYLNDGGISYLQITERINQFPLSIIGVSLGTVLIPMLTTELQQHNMHKALETQNKAIEVSLELAIPIAVFVMIFSSPILAALFMHGKFTEADVLIASPCLIAFISGLPAYVLLKVFSSTFFALKDTLRPAIAGGIAMMINAVLCYLVVNNLIWIGILHHVGIAIALAVSGWVNTLILGGWAFKFGYFTINRDLIKNVIRIKVVTLFVAIVSILLYPWVEPFGISSNFWTRVITSASVVGVGIALYFLFNQVYRKYVRVN